jgi:CHAT domain-containing protein
VLCTRWEARDLVSLLVMDHFYSALGQGQPPGVALRDAQIAVRELTGLELTALIERWNAPDQLTLDAPAEVMPVDLSVVRDIWRGEAPDLIAALDQATAVQPNALESRPFADPLFWAPFMLVGRA